MAKNRLGHSARYFVKPYFYCAVLVVIHYVPFGWLVGGTVTRTP